MIINELYNNLLEIFRRWYPLVIDKEYGGYYSNLSYDWKILPEQEKMIVTQARHIWAASKAAAFLGNKKYKEAAFHGFQFLKEKMLDAEYGGFFQIRSREGSQSDNNGWYDEKRLYGNAFAIYGLAALYQVVPEEEILQTAKDNFYWIEKYASDPECNGYFQFLTKEGIPFGKDSDHKTKASDAAEAGFKDQNSSIHLLEAYTELYHIWKSPQLEERLKNILFLIRDKITDEKGYLRLFFERDWKPVSFRNAPEEIRMKNYGLDHVSFGHDYETAFLMLEASHTLGLKNDLNTLIKAKKMLDHAIKYGWDWSNGGFFDEGYYFDEKGECRIIKDTKVWWSQAEGLNSLLLFSGIFPEEKIYYDLFLQQWEYIKKYMLDTEYGDWYWGSLEKEPFYKTGPKGTIWKCTYHTGRALMNCIKMLADESFHLLKSSEGFKIVKNESDKFVDHWRRLGERL